jgi:hypothetical protein
MTKRREEDGQHSPGDMMKLKKSARPTLISFKEPEDHHGQYPPNELWQYRGHFPINKSSLLLYICPTTWTWAGDNLSKVMLDGKIYLTQTKSLLPT